VTARLSSVYAALSLLRADRLLETALERRLVATGLSVAAGEVVVRLGAAPGGSLGMLELAFATCLHHSAVSRIVDRLERRKLVVRRLSSEDRRVTLIDLTEAGRELMWGLLAAFEESVQQDFARFLSPEDIEALAEGLERLVAGLRGANLAGAVRHPTPPTTGQNVGVDGRCRPAAHRRG
jgi:MarR family 2-MHQ and catechol resistance regulon transcriptional repressor